MGRLLNKSISKLNKNKDSNFYGFDGLKGLPSDWNDFNPKGSFDVNGIMPNIEDKELSLLRDGFRIL